MASHTNDDEEELSPLEYARLNQLCRDYLSEPLPHSHIEALQREDLEILVDHPRLPLLELPDNFSTDERLTLSKDAARLLASVTQDETDDSIDTFVLSMLDCRYSKKLRVEMPLLRSDHETDCREFALRDSFEIRLQDIQLPLEVVDEANNEGLGWSIRLRSLSIELMEQLKLEKLEVRRDTMGYFQNAVKVNWTDEDDNEIWSSLMMYKRNTALEPVTPPLLPISPRPQPYEPSSPACHIPLISDTESPTAAELKAVEEKIFEIDVPTPIRNMVQSPKLEYVSDASSGTQIVKMRDIYSPLASLDSSITSPTLEIKRDKIKDLKIEEPLTPLKSAPALPKSVNFNDFIEDMLLDQASLPGSDGFADRFFQGAFGDAAQKALLQSEQEKLIEADVSARVDVPKMDFSLAEPPWRKLQLHRNPAALSAMQREMIQEIVAEVPKWPGSSRHDLRWSPFPSNLAKVALEEDYAEDDSTWTHFVKGPGDESIIDSSCLTWKQPGLRILREDDDDDELERGIFQQDPHDLSSLAKKRKMEMDERYSLLDPPERLKLDRDTKLGQKMSTRAEHHVNVEEIMHTKHARSISTSKSNDFISAKQKLESDNLNCPGLLLGPNFSAGDALDNFLELRGLKKQKLTDIVNFPPTKNAKPEEQHVNPQQQITIELPIHKSPVPVVGHLPTPHLIPPTDPISIIVSSSLLRRRSLIKHLQRRLHSLVLVERDFTAHNTTAWIPNSVTRSPVTSPLASEADLIVSPSTGIVLTTLQKIKQKPLPGHKAQTAIREQVEKVSRRYEKLVVLVSEGKGDETTNGLDNIDCLAITEFVAFAAGLTTDAAVKFVAGGEENLSKWLSSTIVQYRVTGEAETKLLEEETHWELFLRRAGMNAFAAQGVVAKLKVPDGVDGASPSKAGLFGLTGFVEMGREARIDMFEGMLGGRRVLDRISAVVDALWK